MIERLQQKEIIYEGLVFSIVPMVELREILTPDIDLNLLEKVVLLSLAHHPIDLTEESGNLYEGLFFHPFLIV